MSEEQKNINNTKKHDKNEIEDEESINRNKIVPYFMKIINKLNLTEWCKNFLLSILNLDVSLFFPFFLSKAIY